MSKRNIGAALALYPCPVIVVGAMVNNKPTWSGDPCEQKAFRQCGRRVLAEGCGPDGNHQRQ